MGVPLLLSRWLRPPAHLLTQLHPPATARAFLTGRLRDRPFQVCPALVVAK